MNSDEAENLFGKYLAVLQHERQHKMHTGFYKHHLTVLKFLPKAVP